ncbi:MAG: thymidine phosphorylase [Candidatus Marinimicrobia bacterium]|nr:thymidine phosphorylase [Candidatus Neomarinimicrobiota bacterium]
MDPKKTIKAKQNQSILSSKEIDFLVSSYSNNQITDEIMTEFLKAVKDNGMNMDETISLTKTMIDSGEKMDFSHLNSYVADKHSTGGVGDKVSLILGPLMTSLGITIPMIAGRSLGHTGGTIDKLETIPGFKTDLSIQEFKNCIEKIGLCIMSQTDSICPADKKMYALRDVTNTIDSMPLICGSIMSKKIAEGIRGLVLDIKIGNGAFMKNLRDGKDLASKLMKVGGAFNVSTDVIFSNMDQPLGRTAGMWCEVNESINAMKGESAEDLMNVVYNLGTKMLLQAKIVKSATEARQIQIENIRNGKALKKFQQMVKNQSGQIDLGPKINNPSYSHEVVSEHDGYVSSFDTTAIGWALVELGCGRKKSGDVLDNSAGIEFYAKVGEKIKKGEAIFRCFGSRKSKLKNVVNHIENTFCISDEKVKKPETIY